MRWAVIVVVLFACGCERSTPVGQQPGSAASGSASGSALAPQRIVTLTPSATEIVAALGAANEIVGVDDYSEYPPEVKQLPKVGSFLQPNQEVILSLRPTFVIVDDIHSAVAGALHDRGLQTIECDMHALPDVKSALRRVGARIGRAAKAEEVVTQIDADLDAAAAARPAKHPRVLAIIDREAGGLGNLVAAGPGSWVDELLAVVGGDNVLAASGIRYPKISLEEVIRTQPDVILDISFAGRGELASWNAVNVPAVKTGHVRLLKEQYVLSPSPRVKAALDDIAQAIR